MQVFGLPLECDCAGALTSLTAHDVQVNKRGVLAISRIQTLLSSLCCHLYTLWCSAVPSGRETPPMTMIIHQLNNNYALFNLIIDILIHLCICT